MTGHLRPDFHAYPGLAQHVGVGGAEYVGSDLRLGIVRLGGLQAVDPNTRLVMPLYIEPGTIIGADCVIGTNIYLERGCRIGKGVMLRDAVILRESIIPPGYRFSDLVIY